MDETQQTRAEAAVRNDPSLMEMLENLPDGEWVRPLDMGGRSNSKHSYWLTRLVKLGFADKKQRVRSGRSRPSCRYQRNAAGADLMARINNATEKESKNERV